MTKVNELPVAVYNVISVVSILRIFPKIGNVFHCTFRSIIQYIEVGRNEAELLVAALSLPLIHW